MHLRRRIGLWFLSTGVLETEGVAAPGHVIPARQNPHNQVFVKWDGYGALGQSRPALPGQRSARGSER